MPELPEVETIRLGLEPYVVGSRILDVAVHHPRAVRRHVAGAAAFRDQLIGQGVQAAVRRGKYLWLLLEGSRALVIHLGMSGQLLVHHGEPPPHRHLRVSLRLTDDRSVSFVDQRTFGHLLVTGLVPTSDGGPGGLGSDRSLIPEVVAHIAR
ncbi:MAG TPA: DNA-formamidopyrimidine glycosylase family protein, partial [Actinomycetaceae bacterium]|nr:DNA-formamidopyrimidine glycosylase family protein [Actinomycetaceae bacterium]